MSRVKQTSLQKIASELGTQCSYRVRELIRNFRALSFPMQVLVTVSTIFFIALIVLLQASISRIIDSIPFPSYDANNTAATYLDLGTRAKRTLSYNKPERLQVGRAVRQQVRIEAEPTTDASDDLVGPGAVINGHIITNALLRVKLVGDETAFKILPVSSGDQLLLREDVAEWNWEVTPLQAGQHNLYIQVSLRLPLEEAATETKDLKPIVLQIYNEQSTPYSIRRFVFSNWQYLLTALLLPIAAWGGRFARDQWRQRRGRQTRSSSKATSRTAHGTFECYTDQARNVLIDAQKAAISFRHPHIGTEHILRALVNNHEGVGASVLESLGISSEAGRARVRVRVDQIVDQRQRTSVGHIRFSPHAKKSLELARREASWLGHKDVDTEHILLGLIREGRGVAAQVLVELGADLSHVRQQVIRRRGHMLEP